MSELTHRSRLLILAVCCTSLLIAGLDATAINVALPDIGRDLNASVSGLQWTIDGYTLAVAGLLMLAGSSADRIGRRRVFLGGLVLFTASSFACSLAVRLDWLVAFRVAQGLGASMLTPVALSILTDTFTDPRERTRAIGLWGGTFGLSLALGPVLGGLLVACAGWRSVFWINVPVGVAAIVLVAALVPESRAEDTPRPDPAGQALVVTALAAVTYAIIEGSHRGYGSILIIGLLALAAAATTMLAGYEHRRHRPPIDPAFAGAALSAVAAFVALSGFLFLNTLYLQDVRGYDVLHAGLLTAPMAAAAAIASPISGHLTAAHGPRLPLIAGGRGAAAGRRAAGDQRRSGHRPARPAGRVRTVRRGIRPGQRPDHGHRRVRYAAPERRRVGRDLFDGASDRQLPWRGTAGLDRHRARFGPRRVRRVHLRRPRRLVAAVRLRRSDRGPGDHDRQGAQRLVSCGAGRSGSRRSASCRP